MEIIKERVAQVLDSKGVLSRLKAELRANVFLAINEQDIKDGGVGLSSKSDLLHREELLADPAGVLVVELVREFMRWCNLQFTLQVFDPEMQLPGAALDRNNLAQQLGLDGSGPLLLQLLNQHVQGAPQPERLPAFKGTPEALAAAAAATPAVSVLPAGDGIASSAPAYTTQLQQQHNTSAAGALHPTAVLSKAVQGTAESAAVKQASKSASIMEDIDFDDELINTQPIHEEDDEDYAAVFLAAQGHSDGSAHGSEDSSSSSNALPQQQPRPVRAMQGLESGTLHQASVIAPEALDRSDSFGSLDRSQATLGLDLHGLESPPQALHTAPIHPPPSAEAAAGTTTDAEAEAEAEAGGSNTINGAGNFISPDSSCADLHPPQHMAPPLTAAVTPGRLTLLEPLGPLRPNKLAPLGPVKGPGLVGVSSSSSAPAKASGSEELKEELRRAGLIASTNSSPGASSSTSPQGQIANNALHDDEQLDSPGSLGAAAAMTDVQQSSGSGITGIGHRQAPGALPPAVAAAAGGAVYGSAMVDDVSSDDDDDSADFALSARELFAAARRQLSQSSQSEQQPVQEQQALAVQGSAVGGAQEDQEGSVTDSDDIIDDIPEDFSGNLPIEDLQEGDLDAVYRTDLAPVTGTNATAAAADQLGMSFDVHETGLSLSEKLGGVAGLTSADLLDEDDF